MRVSGRRALALRSFKEEAVLHGLLANRAAIPSQHSLFRFHCRLCSLKEKIEELENLIPSRCFLYEHGKRHGIFEVKGQGLRSKSETHKVSHLSFYYYNLDSIGHLSELREN